MNIQTPISTVGVHTRHRGIALVLVLFAIATAFILSLSFMNAQSTNAGIARNVQNQTNARHIAESAINLAVDQVLSNSNFRNQFANGAWVTNQSYAGGTFSIFGEDGIDTDGDGIIDGDGNLANNASDPVTITVVATYGGATHKVSVTLKPGDTSSAIKVLLIVDDSTNLTDDEKTRKAWIESWGYDTTTLTDSANTPDYTAALEEANVVYVCREADVNSVGAKLDDTTLGVVHEPRSHLNNFGFTNGSELVLTDTIEVTDKTHYITASFELGPLVISNSAMSFVQHTGSLASGAQVLGQTPGTGERTLAVMEVGAQPFAGSNVVLGRRVALPWGDLDLSIEQLNSNGRTIMRRALEWAILPPEGPPALAHWRLDDGVGTIALDDRGTHHGTVVGGARWSAGTLAGSLEFDGTNDYIRVPDHDDFDVTNALSISTWIKGDSWGSGANVDVILRKGEGNPNKWQFAIKDGRPTVFFETYDDYGIKGTTTLSTDQWYHVAATWDGSNVKIYVNGELDNGPNGTSYTSAIGIDDRTLYVGGRGGTTDLFDGMLDDVRFYNRALNPLEIKTMYEEGQQAGEVPRLIARYAFNEVKPDAKLLSHWTFDQSPTGGGGLAAKNYFRVRDTARIDSYNSNVRPYTLKTSGQNAFASVNSTGSNKFYMDTSSSLWGHAFCGAGGSPNSVINAHEGAISGQRLAQFSNVPMPTLAAPSSMPATQGPKTIIGITTWLTDQTFSDLLLSGAATVTVVGNIRVHCTGNFNAVGNAQIVIPSGSSLELYVNGAVDIRGDAKINNDSTRTKQLTIFNYGSGNILIRENAIVAGQMRTNFDFLIRDLAMLFGSIRANDEIYIEDRSQVHSDNALPNLGIADPPVHDETDLNPGQYRNGIIGMQAGAAAHTSNALYFDGIDDFVEIPHHDRYLNRSGAVAFWFKTDDASMNQGLFSKDSSGFDDGGQMTIGIVGGKVIAVLESTTASHGIESDTIAADTWYHVVFTFGPNGMKLFLNGTLSDQNSHTGGLGTTSGGTGNFEPIAIGANTSSSGNKSLTGITDYFKGYIDDVQLFNYALDAAQSANVMNGETLIDSTLASSVIADTSNFGTKLDIHIPDTSKIQWESGGGVTVNSVTTLASALPGKKITDAVKLTNQMTLELIFTPTTATQTGPARIASFSQNSSAANFMVGQANDLTEFRLRTTTSSTNGTPAIQSGSMLAADVEQHIIITFDGENMKLFRNGSLIKTEPRDGLFTSWDDTWKFTLASEIDGSNRWLGTLSRLTVYDRSLNQNQVRDVFQGLPPGLISGKGSKITWVELP